MRPAKWDLSETILLVDAYFRLTTKDSNDYGRIATELSALLRTKGAAEGKKVTDIFRNVTGVTMKLHNIEYLDTNGSKGLSTVSVADKWAFELRRCEPGLFYQAVQIERDKVRKIRTSDR